MKIQNVLSMTIVPVLLLSTSVCIAGTPAEAKLLSEAKVTQQQAEITALAKVPGGKVQAAELEREHGKLVWAFDITQAESKNIREIQVDAVRGDVVSSTVETPADHAKEAAEEKKEGAVGHAK